MPSAEQGGEGRACGLGGAELGEERVIEAGGVDIFGDEQGGAIGDAHHPDGHALVGVEGTTGDDVAEEVAADAAAAEEHYGEHRLHWCRHLGNLDLPGRKQGISKDG